MDIWKTFGHAGVKNILGLQLAAGVFPHAYLFSGPEGVGKKTLALEFAMKILGTANLYSHPDFAILDEPAAPSIERVREFMEPLKFKPFSGKYKIAVINNADLLNIQSSNALLKTLEEPSASTILILISSVQSLLPTVVSRCQVFAFQQMTKSQMLLYAKQNNVTYDDEIIGLSFGRISRLHELQNKVVAGKLKQLVARWESIKRASVADRLLQVGEFAEMEYDDIKQVLMCWLLWQSSLIFSQVQESRFVQNLLDAQSLLEMNKNKKLIFQTLFLKI